MEENIALLMCQATRPYRSVIFWDPETKALEMPVNIG